MNGIWVPTKETSETPPPAMQKDTEKHREDTERR